MCLNPRKIINRSNHFDESKPYYLTVPCGKCPECCNNSCNEWFTRSYFEWTEHPVSTFFYTLTFNEEHLPHFMNIPCFNKKLVQKFIKRLRARLAPSRTLKYLITSEFGETYGRPHHHVEFFVSEWINPFQFYKLVEECWTYGFVKPGKNVGQVNNMNALRYVTKYITKDFSHTDIFYRRLAPIIVDRFNRVYDNFLKVYNCQPLYLYYSEEDNVIRYRKLGNDFELDDFSKNFIRRVRKVLSSCSPFHLQSSRLGMAAFNSPYVNFEDEYLSIMHNDMTVHNYPIPRYFKRKLWYDCVENENDGKRNKFVLNEEGIKHYINRLPYKIEEHRHKLETSLLNTSLVTEEVVTMVNSVLSKIKFSNKHDLIFYLRNLDLDLNVMAIYSAVFRDRCNFIPDIELNNTIIKDNYIDIADYCLHYISSYDFGKLYELERLQKQELEYSLFNNHSFFQIYEEALTILEVVSLSHRIETSQFDEKQEKLVRNIRQLFNK